MFEEGSFRRRPRGFRYVFGWLIVRLIVTFHTRQTFSLKHFPRRKCQALKPYSMLPGGGFSPYGVDMFPGGVHGGTGLPSPAAYGNPAAAQFGVSLKIHFFGPKFILFFLELWPASTRWCITWKQFIEVSRTRRSWRRFGCGYIGSIV